MKRLFTAALMIAVTSVVTPMLAHHSSAGIYSKEMKTMTGTVKEFRFVNPHPVLLWEVKNDKGVVEVWTSQFHAASRMARMFGWNRATFKAGDKITIKGHPAFKGHILNPVYITLPNGKEEGVAGEVAPNNY